MKTHSRGRSSRKKTNPQARQGGLRDRAEKALGEVLAEMRDVPVEELPKLIHELRVHQVELELQNEELRQSQDALALSRDKYVELYDFAPVGYFTLNGNGLILEVNLAGARLLGLERALLIRKRFSRFIAPDFQDHYYFHIKKALASGEKQVCELLLLPAEGAGFHAQLQTVAQVDNQGIDQLRIAVMDVAARVRLEEELRVVNQELEQRVAVRTSELSNRNQDLQEEIVRREVVEEMLRESETQHRLVVENASEGIIVTQDANICFTNSRFEQISGYPRAKLRDRSITDLVHPDDAAMLLEHHWQALAGKEEPIPFTFRMVNKEGETRWLQSKRVLIEWNNSPAILSFLEDITVRLHSEKALLESEDRLRNIFLESPIGIAVYDHFGLLRSANKSYLDIFGLNDEGQLQGTLLFNAPYLGSDVINKLRRGIPVREVCLLRPNTAPALKPHGTTTAGTMSLDVLITPLGLSQKGSQGGYMVQVQDISARVQAQEGQRVLSGQLILAHEDERRMISRDLHDCVGQDLVTAKIGLDELGHVYPDACPGILEKIAFFSGLIGKSISDIRDMAYEQHPLGLEQFGFARTIAHHVSEFSEKTGIDVDLSLVGVDKLILGGDASINLYRLIQEALRNIQKHAQAQRVVVKVLKSFSKTILRIEDDGVGFDPVQRAASASGEKRMGLRSMQERATLLGGTMRIRSRPGKGTKILVELPSDIEPA